MKRLLVTGGAGFLGYHICNKLAKHYDEVVIIDIDTFIKEDYPSNTRYIKLDIRHRKALSELMKKERFSAIIHGAAALPLYKPVVIRQVNIGGTKNVLDAALKHKVERVVFISSTAVYGVPKKHPIYEGDPRIGVGPYGETKIIAEKLCEAYRKKGLCVPIIRPKTFIGTTRLGVFQILYDWVESGKRIPIIGNGKNRYQLLEVEDLVDSIHLTLTRNKKKANDTFNVAAETFKTVNEDVSALCNYAKSGARVFPTPSFLVKPALITLEAMKLSP
ncbi:MAG: NAD(P)-dependent oxidoreductase, partial [Nanoarchaeota archaeon]